jgi:hypothetical protein
LKEGARERYVLLQRRIPALYVCVDGRLQRPCRHSRINAPIRCQCTGNANIPACGLARHTHTHTHTQRERERERERDRFTHVFVRYTKHGEVQCAVTAVCGAGGTICRESRSILILRLIDFRDRHPGRWSRSRKARKGRCAPATGYKFRLEISVPLEDV